ncbi:MAG TPA: SDR family NAD(P)-dependent oxidoreductase [Alphaproteobacteria bacterium]|nr:SDR family NAD(P)-dependent oxidoreductase [Alphaproteobacteria bacterium]
MTGGGRGIGAAVAARLAALGADLTLLGRSQAPIEAQAEALEAEYRRPVGWVLADLRDASAVTRAFATMRERREAPLILVNNAGGATSAAFLRTDRAMWDDMLGSNLTGAYLCIQAALPAMLEAGWGRIVNIASTAGLIGYRYVSAYCAAKHGLVGLTRALALELARKGITVNAVCPGFTETDLVARSIAAIVETTGMSAAAARSELVKANPQGRLVEPREVASAVAWLCLPEAAAVNGQCIAVDGGEVMR